MRMAVRTAIPKLPSAKRAIVLTLMVNDKTRVRTSVVTTAANGVFTRAKTPPIMAINTFASKIKKDYK